MLPEISLRRSSRLPYSPHAIQGSHGRTRQLSDLEAEQLHRISTDPGRLNRAWFDGLGDNGSGGAAWVSTLAPEDAIGRRMGICMRRCPTAARADIANLMGGAALTDAAAVAALFNAIDRVADATGILLEDAKAETTADFRTAIGIDDFAAAAIGSERIS